MNIRFNGQVVMITGGTQGIGYQCAKQFLEGGAKVAVCSNAMTDCENTLKEFGIVKAYELDVSNVEKIQSVVEQIRNDLGEIDILVNAAGVMPTIPAVDLTEEQWDFAFGVNAKGTFFVSQAVAKQSMLTRGSGAIVNFISMAGMKGMAPPLCSVNYSASKGAAVQITRQLATEWGPEGIRTNAVAPGPVRNGMFLAAPERVGFAAKKIPLGKLAEEADIANSVCFLASSAANQINGQILMVDGGGSIQY